jgi:2-iminobutanoate/2-iminopropanoate deaminase
MKKVHGSSESTNAPLSTAWEAGGTAFVSGQIHADAQWKLMGETIEEKFAITMGNVEKALAEAGLTKNDIIHVRLYLTDLSELPALNKVYVQYFAPPMPARAAIGVAQLPLGASLEVEVVAAR